MTGTNPAAEHECGICDGPLDFFRFEGVYATYTCPGCGQWHTSKDCCHVEVSA